MARWLHALQQFQFSIIHRPGRDHGNVDGLSRVPASPYRQCTRPDCPPVVEVTESVDQPFDSESTGSSEEGVQNFVHWHFYKSNMATATPKYHYNDNNSLSIRSRHIIFGSMPRFISTRNLLKG